MIRMREKLFWAALTLSAALGAALVSGCNTDAFCYADCNGERDTGSTSGGGGSGGAGGDILSGSGGCIFNCSSSSSGAGGAACEVSNGGIELCDGKDNDCNNKVDDIVDLNLESPKTCGTCATNCYKTALNCKVDAIGCTPSSKPGVDPGTCTCSECADDYYDTDFDGKCEYFCTGNATDDTICNNKDDDCDGFVDENVDKCTDVNNCGGCGNTCVVLHGTAACVDSGMKPCDGSNTQCKIQQCVCTGPGDCWKDLDGAYANGCEYNCTETNGAVEVCGDGLDNDCDGKIDEADDLSGDAQIGVICYGDPDGECHTQAHEGVTICQGNKVVCSGMNLLVENQALETCDGKDNDCDSVIDDSPTDVGGSCGQSNIAPCAFGVIQCQNGAKVCSGAVNPKAETCNGQDDNCDGAVDNATVDSGSPCGQSNVGACKLGAIQCNGGVLTCVGSVSASAETCDGIDNDCNGMIDDAVPGTGVSCGQSNIAPCAFGTVVCQNGSLACVGAVNPVQETCDTIDNDCNGVVDDNATGTGVSCGQSNVVPCSFGTIQCQSGALTCVGAVNPVAETCDGIDNNCNGVVDDNPGGTGGTCGQSSVGACQFGTVQCQGGSLTCVGAINPAPQETCNGIDDDCNGVVDNSPIGTGASCGQSNIPPCSYGTIQCSNGALTCVGGVNPVSEVCNNVDDNCDGVVDNGTPGSGVACGQSNTFPCSFGTMVCQNGALSCVGAVNPSNETCNGIDDNCNGVIDDNPGGTGGTCGQSNVGACKFGTFQCQGGSLVCVGAVNPTAETCNGIDDDCNNVIDNSPSGTGASCGSSNTLPCKFGTIQCSNGSLQCVGAVNPGNETCNLADDDCDGVVDNNLTDTGASCGQSNQFPCSLGTIQCSSGALSCVGAVNPTTETCNGVDDNCDGVIDKTGANPPADSVGPCNVPPPPPAGATSPCVAGTKACVGAQVVCQGSVGPTGPVDTCGVDANCDGQLTNQPNKQTDTANCGSCGNNCYANAVHAVWGCVGGACVFQGCENGYWDLNNDLKCEYACIFVSAQESCNGQDENCNGQIDEGVIAPSPTQVCGVSPSATAAECKSQSQGGLVNVACQNGAWKCTFPAGVCTPNCASTVEVCDAYDNDCDGGLNENVPNYGKPCASDDAAPVPGDGACRTTGTQICNGPNATVCSAVKANCVNLPGGCAELCDGVDNDCDGLIDEVYTAKGTNATFYVKPVVTKIAASSWIYTYESSRPNATTNSPGSGNGYRTLAPAGETLDKTLACSVPNKIPWFNVTPVEIEQTCAAMGGAVCTNPDWNVSCQATLPCTWGYNPRTNASCNTTYSGTNTSNGTKYCNLGPSFDFDGNAANGDQDGLLVTASSALKLCSSDWSGLQGNVGASATLFDITGNLREVTRCQQDRAVCGATGDTAKCAANCCSGTSTAVTQSVRVCGAVGDNRRLSGQLCSANSDCCNTNDVCNGNGLCNNDPNNVKHCQNTGGAAPSCRARGVACTTNAQCCGGETCSGNVCGGAQTIPYSVYPLMGGSFSTADPNGATCTFDFFSVKQDFKLYDAGFRCCFSVDPT